MRLSPREFRGMQSSFRRFLQRRIEFPNFRRMGLTDINQSILEIGCGSGYGAELISTLQPSRYVGIDLMPEQIALAWKRDLPNCEFMIRDAADLGCFEDESWDTVVIFGVLHHVQPWMKVIDEIHRLLRKGGRLFIEEPNADVLRKWDRLFRWGHPDAFNLKNFEKYVLSLGLSILEKRRIFWGFHAYCVRKRM